MMLAFFEKRRFTLLLSSLLLTLIIIPLFNQGSIATYLLSGFISYTLLTGVFALSNNIRTLRVALILAIPHLFFNWACSYSQHPMITRIYLLNAIFFFVYITLVLLSRLLREKEVTGEAISAALSAYLLIGYAWSSVYALIEGFLPGSFKGLAGTMEPRFKFTYYSFVTLTTLGYGDITPSNAIAQSWSILEAIVGQIFLVVVISGLVGNFISTRSATKH